ncbi:UNVERIFIED_CONTAM: hypothetical protein Sradi_4033900 [Sesamum radiatum]|uniref:Uncharacterized protein n=1 Tax=Sesamum radiatum TaxID=300843 RepID=A0AAW2PL13_SESRA
MYFAALARRASNLEISFLARDLKKSPSKSPWEKALAFTSCVAADLSADALSERATVEGLRGAQVEGYCAFCLLVVQGSGSLLRPPRLGRLPQEAGAVCGGAAIGTCSRRAAATTCWIALSKTDDSSSVEVSEEVLRRGRSATGSTTLGGEAQEGGQRGGACHTWERLSCYYLQGLSAMGGAVPFCFTNVWLGFFIRTHVFDQMFPQMAPIDACNFSTSPARMDCEDDTWAF